MEKQNIYLISNIEQGQHREKQIFECVGLVTIEKSHISIEFSNDDIAGTIVVSDSDAKLTYTKPYFNTLKFSVNQSTSANYNSNYGVMALIIDTKQISRLPGKVILIYDLLQAKFKIGTYSVEIRYGEACN